jgi:hypothetical protein
MIICCLCHCSFDGEYLPGSRDTYHCIGCSMAGIYTLATLSALDTLPALQDELFEDEYMDRHHWFGTKLIITGIS